MNNSLGAFLIVILSYIPFKLAEYSPADIISLEEGTKKPPSKVLDDACALLLGIQLVESGSLIIDMGVSPQTIENGLKPYGLVFDLIKNHKIPVLWVIDPDKVSDKNNGFDDVDFSYNGYDYKGGPFIIESKYISYDVNLTIAEWEAKGVVTTTTTSDINVPVAIELDGYPNWTLDAANGSNLFDGFDAAEIPEFNDGNTSDPNYVFKTPDELTCCDYMYAMPHADPTWSTHSNLYNWMQNETAGGCRGWIWAACHAVSALENSFNDVTPAVSQQMNFLSNKTGDADISMSPWAENSLVIWQDHANGDGDYIYDGSVSAHPFMQFIGTMSGALENGSEQIFLPYNGTSWRSSTTVPIYDDDHPDIGGIGAARAAKMAYGPAFGNGSYSDYTQDDGWIMYMGMHDIAGSTEEYVAAYRAFFNFSFMSAFDRGSDVVYVNQPPAEIEQLTTINLSASASGSTGPYTFEWIVDPDVGSFSNNNITVNENVTASTVYTAPATSTAYDLTFTLTVTDGCGIQDIITEVVQIVPSETAPACSNEIITIAPNEITTIDLLTLVTDINNNLDPSAFYISGQPGNGTVSLDASAVATYTPDFNFLGTDAFDYTAVDEAGNTCEGTVSIVVDCPTDSNNNQIWGTVFNDYNADGTLNNSDDAYITGPTIYLYEDNQPNNGVPDGAPIQSTTASITGNYNFNVYDDFLDTTSMSYYLNSNNDDAREKRNGNVEPNKGDHKITKDGDDEWNGFRFNSISIPGDAVILNATITFTSKDNQSGAGAAVRFFGHDNTSNSPAFSSCSTCYGISGRDRTANYVDWSDIEDWSSDNSYTSPDISAIIQEIINDQNGLSNSTVGILTQAQPPVYDERKAYSYDDSPSDAPVLFIEWAYVVPGLEYNYIVEIDVSTLSDPNEVLTTPDQYIVTFDALGTSDCFNNFGIGDGLCRTIYTNRFIRYNR